ncbi:MAG: hypothetical protein NTY65_04325 [Planctomycetota bacterium]|nr:hypothetical protein [Planctomycetota bacterium]
MEVLISIFILSIGLLGVAALIPIGKLALVETNKSDRTGACGRAGLREVKIRRMLDYTTWSPPVDGTNVKLGLIAIDPLGSTGNLGPLPRYSFTGMTATAADAIFRWRDDLVFVRPRDVKSGTPQNADRPWPIFDGANIQSEGNYSWFLTIAPAPGEAALPVAQRRMYNVAVVVCYKRIKTREQRATATCAGGVGYGGVSVTLDGAVPITALNVKEDQWIMLVGDGQASWYRAVNAGPGGTTQKVSLVGPDWYGGTDVEALIIDSVSGVYSTVVQLDQ